MYDGLGYALAVKKDSKFQTVADLKGSTLGVTKVGSLSDTGLKMMLDKEKINPERDVQIVGAGAGATMLAALEGGKVAAGMVPEPTLSQMIASGGYRVLNDPAIDYVGLVVMAKEGWVGKNKETMKAILNTLKEVRTKG